MTEYNETPYDECRADAEWEGFQEAKAQKKRLDGEKEDPETAWYCPNCGESTGTPIEEPGSMTDRATGCPIDEFDGCTLCIGKTPDLSAFELDNSPLPSWAAEEISSRQRSARQPSQTLGVNQHELDCQGYMAGPEEPRSSPPRRPRHAERARPVSNSEVA